MPEIRRGGSLSPCGDFAGTATVSGSRHRRRTALEPRFVKTTRTMGNRRSLAAAFMASRGLYGNTQSAVRRGCIYPRLHRPAYRIVIESWDTFGLSQRRALVARSGRDHRPQNSGCTELGGLPDLAHCLERNPIVGEQF